VGESGREAAVSWRKGGALALGFLTCDDGLVAFLGVFGMG